MSLHPRAAVAVLATGLLALGLAACATETRPARGDLVAAEYDAAVGKIFDPADVRGGTLAFANSGDWDSLDPANTYHGYAWNFLRFYGRTLIMFAARPGAAGTRLVPDLAETLGKPSDGGKTWTYRLRPGLRYENGTAITSMDVKYAIERSLDKETFPNGPTYFNDLLDLQGYAGPYHDPDPNKLGLKAISTPDERTIIFHLKRPFGGFDYLAALPATVPVPMAMDTGPRYHEHVVSSGPYMFEAYLPGENFTLLRNPNWDPATDPHRAALPDRIEVSLNVSANDIDKGLMSGEFDVDVTGSGVQPATRSELLADPSLRKNTDLAPVARLWYASINPDVAPLNDIHCRKAIEYAADHEDYQRAFGGPTGGDIATNMLPPQVPGAQTTDLYNFGGAPNGDVEMAKKELVDCGRPDGFTTNLAYRAEQPGEEAAAESLRKALARVRINVTIKPYPQRDYFTSYAGKPDYAREHQLGIMLNSWSADWLDGYAFLWKIVDSRTIRASGGNSNLSIRLPTVDALIDRALATTDATTRNPIWGQVDQMVMENALVLPGVWARVLLYRPPTLTNVYVNDGLGGFYDFVSLGKRARPVDGTR